MVTFSPVPDMPIPEVGLIQFLFSNPYNTPEDRELLIDASSKKSLTFFMVKDLVLRFAAALQDDFNFKKDDVLAVFSPNQYDYPIPLLGAIAAGGYTTTANPSYTHDDLVHQLETTNAKVIIAHESNVRVAVKAAYTVGIPKSNIFIFGDNIVNGILPYTHRLLSSRRAILEELSPEEARDRVAFVCFSSGTSASVVQFASIERHHLDGNKSKMIATIPLFHIMGLVLKVHVGLHLGVPLHVMAKFKLSKFLETIERERITFAVVVPPIVLMIAKDPIVKNYDLTSLEIIASGAAPLGGDIIRIAEQRLPNLRIKQYYGTTETTATVIVQPTSEIVEGSNGIVLPNMVVKVVDENNNEVPDGQRGELWVKGNTVMKGYLNNPKETEKSIDKDGFFHTGDVVRNQNGHFFIVDRIKELIKYKGFQVAPAEIEALLLKSDLITDCAVIGVYDPSQATEIPQGYIVLKNGVYANKETEDKIKKHVADSVVYYKRLRKIVFVNEIPKNPSGKILRRILRNRNTSEVAESRL